MSYTANVDVHRWKKGQVISEEELLSEGINIQSWINSNFILSQGDSNVKDSKILVSEKKKEVEGDLNGDGVFDKKDKAIAGRVLAKGRKGPKRK